MRSAMGVVMLCFSLVEPPRIFGGGANLSPGPADVSKQVPGEASYYSSGIADRSARSEH